MKRAFLAALAAAVVTSCCWHVLTELHRGRDWLWLESAVKAPGRMALEEIQSDLAAGRNAEAKAKVEVLRRQWAAFEKEKGFSGVGIGNIMMTFAKLPTEQAVIKKYSAPPAQGPWSLVGDTEQFWQDMGVLYDASLRGDAEAIRAILFVGSFTDGAVAEDMPDLHYIVECHPGTAKEIIQRYERLQTQYSHWVQ